MLAFHGLESERQVAIADMKAHREADLLIRGRYWEDGKGCMLGCLTHQNENTHERLEEMYHIPKSLGLLCDTMFEGLPKEEAMDFPVQVLEAIQAGADLTHVTNHFVVFVLRDVRPNADNDGQAAIDTCIALYQRRIAGDEPTSEEWSAAESAAESAARSAARSAAWSAAWSAAESAAWSRYRDELLRLLKDAPIP